jgi:hypothetical protein
MVPPDGDFEMFSTSTTGLIVAFCGALACGMSAVPGLAYEGSLYLAGHGLAFLIIGCCMTALADMRGR